jgi:hypothetical protein
MTRVAVNDVVWGVSLALQCGLLALVWVGGLARWLPCFTFLLAFYPVRAAVLFVLFGRVAPANYAAVYEALSLAGLLLQLLVGVEIGARLFKGTAPRAGYGAWLVPVAAWVGAMVVGRATGEVACPSGSAADVLLVEYDPALGVVDGGGSAAVAVESDCRVGSVWSCRPDGYGGKGCCGDA